MAEGRRICKPHPWKIGEQITFAIESGIFEGIFSSEVVGINPRQGIIQIKFPKINGKLVLIPVGTIVNVKLQQYGYPDEKYTVIDRTSGDHRCLVLRYAHNEENCLINIEPANNIKLITIGSGKGGVGKTTVAINLAFALAERKHKVCILDAALGTGSVDILLDLAPRFNIGHVLAGKCSLMETLIEVRENVYVLPGCSGVQQFTEPTEYEYNILAAELQHVFPFFDALVVDTVPGISRLVTNLFLATKGGLVITTPEPHAITDTYALLKAIANNRHRDINLKLVVNRVTVRNDADSATEKLRFAAKNFLNLDLELLGYIMEDQKVKEAVRQQKPMIEIDPAAQAYQGLKELAAKLFPDSGHNTGKDSKSKLFTKLRNMNKRA